MNESTEVPEPRRQEILGELRRRGFRPSARRGQNFLFDTTLLRALVNDSGVKSGDAVLEIGCGAGTLTRELLRRGCRVLGVELEPVLAEYLASSIRDPHFELLTGDVLDGKNRLAPFLVDGLKELGDAYHLVANLPYAIATPVISLLLANPAPPQLAGMAVLVQSEVAERWLSAPGRRTYGPASVLLQLLGHGAVARKVGREVFWPRPRVDSIFYRWQPDSWDAARARRLQAQVRPLFQKRRKMLRVQLRGILPDEDPWWQEHGIDPRQRPEELDPARWEALAVELERRQQAGGGMQKRS